MHVSFVQTLKPDFFFRHVVEQQANTTFLDAGFYLQNSQKSRWKWAVKEHKAVLLPGSVLLKQH